MATEVRKEDATSRVRLTPPLKWHQGGKHYLAPKIIALMPPRCKNPNAPATDDPGWLHYVEPYFGGGSVLLAHNPDGISEVINDINGELTNFWTMMQNTTLFDLFQRHVEAVPFSELEYSAAGVSLCPESDYATYGGPIVVRAVRFFIRCRQSLSGRMKGFAGITRNRTRKGMNEQVSAWLAAVAGLPAVHARLKRVLVRNLDALDCIRKEDGPRTLFYADPPYCHETRATTGEYGKFEMSDGEHASLLTVLGAIKGRFILSGYRCDLYDTAAKRYSWRREDIEIANHAAGGKAKRRMVECVWVNY